MATPQLDEGFFLELDSRITSGENTVEQINDQEIARQYVEWKQQQQQNKGLIGTAVDVTNSLGLSAEGLPSSAKIGLGGLEAFASFASPMIAAPAAGLKGTYDLILGYFQNKNWYENLKNATENMEGIMGSMVYTPKTEAGKNITAAISSPFMLIDAGTTAVGNLVSSKLGGSVKQKGAPNLLTNQLSLVSDQIQSYRDRNEDVPNNLLERANAIKVAIEQQGGLDFGDLNNPAIFASVTTKTFLDLLPDIAGRGRASYVRSQKINEFRKRAKELGLDLSDAELEQLVVAADGLTGRQRFQGQNLGGFQEMVRRQEKISSDVSEELFNAAKSEEAYFPGLQLKLLDQSMADVVSNPQFDFSTMKIAKGRLQQFSEITNNTAFELLDSSGNVINSYVPVNQLHNFRQLLNADIRKLRRSDDYDAKNEYQALLGMKNHIDTFLEDQFTADLVSGNAESIAKWKKANSWYADHIDKFESSKVVQKIIDNDLEVEQVRKLLVGTGEVLGKAESGAIVRRLNSILGNNSPQMNGLRQEIIFGMITPLLQDAPDIGKFIQNYNKFKRENNTLITELFQGDSLNNLTDLVKIASAQLAVSNRTGVAPKRNISLDRMLALNMAPGNTALARGQASVQLSTQLVNMGTNIVKRISVGVPSRERQIMSEFYGVDMSRPFMNLNNFPVYSVETAGRRAEEKEQGETLPRLQSMATKGMEMLNQ